MLYIKTIAGREVISDCKTILLDYDHPELGLTAGQWVSNPSQELVFDEGWEEYVPPVVPPEPQTDPSMDEVMEAVKKMLSPSIESLTDEEALAVAALYPTFVSKIGEQVNTGERLWWDERLWKVLQPHTVQDNWTPDTATSLYVEVSIEEWPEWVQPLGAQDAYPIEAHVSHNGGHWESEIDNNVYEPGVYGWRQVD